VPPCGNPVAARIDRLVLGRAGGSLARLSVCWDAEVRTGDAAYEPWARGRSKGKQLVFQLSHMPAEGVESSVVALHRRAL